MQNQKKDVYYKKNKYKSKYLALKRHLSQIGGAGELDELLDPLYNDPNGTAEFFEIIAKLYWVGRRRVGVLSNTLEGCENYTENALIIHESNKRICYLNDSDRIVNYQYYFHDYFHDNIYINEFIKRCGVFVDADMPDVMTNPDFKLHIMPNDILIPISANNCCAEILSLVLKGVVSNFYYLQETSGNPDINKRIVVTKPYLTTNEHMPRYFDDDFKAVFGYKTREPKIATDDDDAKLFNAEKLHDYLQHNNSTREIKINGRVIIFCTFQTIEYVLDKLLGYTSQTENFNNIYLVQLPHYLESNSFSNPDVECSDKTKIIRFLKQIYLTSDGDYDKFLGIGNIGVIYAISNIMTQYEMLSKIFLTTVYYPAYDGETYYQDFDLKNLVLKNPRLEELIKKMIAVEGGMTTIEEVTEEGTEEEEEEEIE